MLIILAFDKEKYFLFLMYLLGKSDKLNRSAMQLQKPIYLCFANFAFEFLQLPKDAKTQKQNFTDQTLANYYYIFSVAL